ncbi:xanthine/uracil permease family protein [Novosphingobium nitrogenifigens DSM 19370]|uniref:Xanthine/uracil permease family protein n=2 Tax=Novosphingobium nitrogenifigens TaxID=378548 RepID=F1Z6I7_9SPHN|nr:xanthine/uracil permease family protein [Novosphingobium nitrogenifigens DSM 19370]
MKERALSFGDMVSETMTSHSPDTPAGHDPVAVGQMAGGNAVSGDAVDSIPAPGRLFMFALQHVLVMYAGAVTVPLVMGQALHLSPSGLTLLVCADLVAAGIVTLIQTLGIPGVGIRLPIMMGVTFVSVSPMLALLAAAPETTAARVAMLPTIYGAVIVGGIFGLIVAPFVGRMQRFFPPTVTGTVILVIGLSLMRIAIDWAAGGQPSDVTYGQPSNLGIALLTLVTIFMLIKFSRGPLRYGAILFGVVIGTLVAALFGHADFSEVARAPWFALILPFQFGLPRFEAPISLAMCFVMLVSMVESFGMFLTAGVLVGRPADARDLTRGLRADALGTLIGGIFNTFPYTSYAQNLGLLSMTGVRSRYVCAAGGAILIALGLCPKLAAIVAAVPLSVLGGAGLVMFGMIAATGVRILSEVELTYERLAVIAASVAMGLIPVLSQKFFQYMPPVLGPILHSGIVLASATAMILNLFLHGSSTVAESPAE